MDTNGRHRGDGGSGTIKILKEKKKKTPKKGMCRGTYYEDVEAVEIEEHPEGSGSMAYRDHIGDRSRHYNPYAEGEGDADYLQYSRDDDGGEYPPQWSQYAGTNGIYDASNGVEEYEDGRGGYPEEEASGEYGAPKYEDDYQETEDEAIAKEKALEAIRRATGGERAMTEYGGGGGVDSIGLDKSVELTFTSFHIVCTFDFSPYQMANHGKHAIWKLADQEGLSLPYNPLLQGHLLRLIGIKLVSFANRSPFDIGVTVNYAKSEAMRSDYFRRTGLTVAGVPAKLQEMGVCILYANDKVTQKNGKFIHYVRYDPPKLPGSFLVKFPEFKLDNIATKGVSDHPMNPNQKNVSINHPVVPWKYMQDARISQVNGLPFPQTFEDYIKIHSVGDQIVLYKKDFDRYIKEIVTHESKAISMFDFYNNFRVLIWRAPGSTPKDVAAAARRPEGRGALESHPSSKDSAAAMKRGRSLTSAAIRDDDDDGEYYSRGALDSNKKRTNDEWRNMWLSKNEVRGVLDEELIANGLKAMKKKEDQIFKKHYTVSMTFEISAADISNQV